MVILNLQWGYHPIVRKCSHLLLWEDNGWNRIVFPGGAKAAIGEGRAAHHSQWQQMPAWPALLFLTYHLLSRHIMLVRFFFFLWDFIFGLDKATDLEVAAGTWKYHLPCLFHWTELSSTGILTWVILRIFQSWGCWNTRPIKQSCLSWHGNLWE